MGMKKIEPATPELIAELKSEVRARKRKLASRLTFFKYVEGLEKYQFVNVRVSEKVYKLYKAWGKKYSDETGKEIRVRMISDEMCRISRV